MKKVFTGLILLMVLTALPLCYPLAEAENVALNIYGKGGAGEWDNPLLAEKYPYITWQGNDWGDFSTIIQSLGKDSPDVFGIAFANNHFEAVISKGYSYDLAAYEEISEAVNAMHPFIQKAVKKGDAVLGVPTQLTCSNWAYSKKAFAAAEIPNERIPATYADLLDFLFWWVEEGAYAYPDVRIIRGTTDIRQALIEKITFDLIDICWYREEMMDFSSPEISEIFKKLDTLDFDKENEFLSHLKEGDIYDYHVLFDLRFDWLDFPAYADAEEMTPLPLKISANDKLLAPVDMRLFFLSPSSAYPNEAAFYVQSYLQSRDDVFRTIAYNTPHEPILNARVAEELAILQQELGVIEASLIGCSETDKEGYENQREIKLRIIESLQKYKWEVSKDAISAYESLVPYLFIRKYSPLGGIENDSYSEIKMLIDRYSQKQISAGNFLLQLQKKIDAILREQV
jgi:hypothetical protein